jgi:O-methyltransferase involved in polyketide biosynthesis
MLITLYARAMVSRSRNPILADSWAEEAVSRIDYDFESLHVGGLRACLVAIRAKQLDLWTTRFLMDRPDATVLHLGCGLDSRVFRVDPPEGVRWFDVDYPEVIDMRRRLYPQRAGCRMVPASLEQLDWLEVVPGGGSTFVAPR